MTPARHTAHRPSRHRTSRTTLRGSVLGIVAGVSVSAGLLAATTAWGSTLQTVPAREAPPVGAPVVPGLATAGTPAGTVVTSDGFTVYRFDQDAAHSATPTTSTCVGACAKDWPPLLGDGVPPLSGIPAGLVGTIGRPDGTQQLTLNGWPLYRSAQDTRPGDVQGTPTTRSRTETQADTGTPWHAIGPDGRPATP